MQLDVYNMKGEIVDKIELSDDIFAIEPNEDALYRVAIAQQANKRQGTHKVKDRSEVRGGGRKPFRQKGTGRARQGSSRSPKHVGGGVVFGPTPRSYRVRLPKKLRRLALFSALSVKANSDKIIVLDDLTIENGKTREMVEVLKNLGVDSTSLVVTTGKNDYVVRSARNLQGVKTAPVNALSVLDILKYDRLIATREALETFQEVYES
ncbi:MAG TPA: 50S ribosomal protein L4 [Clostridiaceae bacterium]|jgi:large subunit ribosomal protein L4|nr:50S ribosomal protein L4 [Clostridiaceae bacterium]